MKWVIAYYSARLEKEILNLPDTLLGKYIRITDVMQEFGPNIGMPHTRAMGDGLFELRLRGAEGIARVFYCTLVNNTLCFLHCMIKKTQTTPLKDLQLARLRMLEVKQNDT